MARMALVGVESEEDLLEDPQFLLPSFDTLRFKKSFCCHIPVAFEEHQRYITPHETMIHIAFVEVGIGCTWMRSIH
jgi:hypothetical protein